VHEGQREWLEWGLGPLPVFAEAMPDAGELFTNQGSEGVRHSQAFPR
jgi:hypothetical protein